MHQVRIRALKIGLCFWEEGVINRRSTDAGVFFLELVLDLWSPITFPYEIHCMHEKYFSYYTSRSDIVSLVHK